MCVHAIIQSLTFWSCVHCVCVWVLQLSKSEDIQELEYHLSHPTSSENSTPWTSERQSEVSEPPLHGVLVVHAHVWWQTHATLQVM